MGDSMDISNFISRGDLEARQDELLKVYRRRIRAVCTKADATKLLKWLDEWIAAPAPKPVFPADMLMVQMQLRIDTEAALAWKEIEVIEQMKSEKGATG